MATDPRAQVVIDGNVAPLRQALREGAAAMQTFGAQSSGAMGGLSSAAGAFKSQMLGIVGVITGGAFSAFIKTQVNLQDEFSKAAQKAGVTTEQYSSMAYAARLADVSSEQLTKTYAKLSLALVDAQQGQKEAVDLFKRLKLDPKGVKDADDLLLKLADRFESLKTPAERTALAIDILGEKLGPGLVPLLNTGREGLEALRLEAEQLGIVVSTKTGQDAEKFNDTLTTMGEAGRGAALKLSAQLLPAMQAVADEMLNLVKGSDAASAVFSGIRIVFETVAVAGANVLFVLGGIGREIAAVGAQVAAALRGDFASWSVISDAVKRDGEEALARLEAFERRVLSRDTVATAVAQRSAGGSSGVGPKPSNAKTAASASAPAGYMQYYELLLAEEKRVQSILDAGREYSKEQELAYWRWLAANAQLTSADKVAIARKTAALEVEIAQKAARKTAALEVEIAQKAARDKAALDGEYVNQAEAAQLGALDAQRAAAQVALDLEQITKAQFLQADAQYEQQRYEIARAALVQRLQLLADDPNSSELAKLQLNGKLLELDRQYAVKRIEILGGIAKEAGAAGGVWTDMTSGFGSALQGMLSGTQSWAGAILTVFAGVRDAFIRYMVTEPAAKWVAGQAQMMAAKLGFLAAEQVAQKTASLAIAGQKTTEAGIVVGANAAEAGSEAGKAVAGIPIVGPGLAIAAMAAVFAAAMALLGGGNKSARGGYDIPSGIDPLTQLHEEEMVLPSEHANVIRRLAGDPSAGGLAPASQAPVHIHTQGGDFIHKRDLARLLRQMQRDFVFV